MRPVGLRFNRRPHPSAGITTVIISCLYLIQPTMASTNDVNATNDNVTLNTETIAPDTQSPGSSRDTSPEFDTLFVPPKDFVFKTPEMVRMSEKDQERANAAYLCSPIAN